jgi:hypothetical protein
VAGDGPGADYADVRCYALNAVPDLLQTADYAAAVIRASRPELSEDQVSKLVLLQMRRQQLTQRSGLRLHMIIDESALQRAVAPAQVMAKQLEHLAALRDQKLVTVHTVTASMTPGVISPPFTLLSFADNAESAAACYHGPGGRIVVTRRGSDARVMLATFNALAKTAS